MSNKKDLIIQWIFIAMFFVPTMILAHYRLHHRNFALFVLLSIISITIVWFAYLFYLKKIGYVVEDEPVMDAKIVNIKDEDD